jgi:probable HAF family extracellular repeat protein
MRVLSWTRCAVVAAPTVLAVAAQANSYTIVDLGPMTAVQINDHGEIAGYGPTQGAQVYAQGRWSALPRGGHAYATAIDSHGNVAGDKGKLVLAWPQGNTLRHVPLPAAASHSYAVVIADDGTIAGTYYPAGHSRSRCFRTVGALGPSPRAQDLGNLPGARECELLGGNALGALAGDATVGNFSQAFLWEGDRFQPLGLLPGGRFSLATAVNDRGHVVGAANAPPHEHAFLWRDGVMKDIGMSTEFLDNYAAAINASGEIVGNGVDSTYQQHALRFADGQVIDLQSEVTNLGAWTLNYAYSINADGVIIGSGVLSGLWHDFMLMPQDGQ